MSVNWFYIFFRFARIKTFIWCVLLSQNYVKGYVRIGFLSRIKTKEETFQRCKTCTVQNCKMIILLFKIGKKRKILYFAKITTTRIKCDCFLNGFTLLINIIDIKKSVRKRYNKNDRTIKKNQVAEEDTQYSCIELGHGS